MRPLSLVVLAACAHPAPRELIATPAAGVSLLYYQGGGKAFTVVDDRRWVEVRGGVLALDHIDQGAALPSLLIEPLGGSLTVGPCDRDRDVQALPPAEAADRYRAWQARRRERAAAGDVDGEPELPPDATLTIISPIVRCTARGAGRQLVRVLYVSSALAYTAEHTLAIAAPDRATLATRFALATPSWGGRADVTLYAGVPGGEHPPLELARGSVALDGSTAILGAPPHEVPARLRRVFDGGIRAGVGDATDPTWGRDSVHAVWVWLELPGIALAPGPAHAHLALPGEPPRDLDVPAAGRITSASGSRLPLWIDESLRALRTRSVVSSETASLADRFTVAITNLAGPGTAPREVWIEEKLRSARRRSVKAGSPVKPTLGAEYAREKVTVKPGSTERVSYVIDYDF